MIRTNVFLFTQTRTVGLGGGGVSPKSITGFSVVIVELIKAELDIFGRCLS